MNIALPLRQKHFDPFALGADDFHLRPVGKLGEGVIVHPCAGADIQIAAAGGHGAGAQGLQPLQVGSEQDAILGDGHGSQAAQQFGELVQGVTAGLRIIAAGNIFIIGNRDFRGFVILREVCLRFGVVRFTLPAAGKGRDRKGRGTERHGQSRRKQADDRFILHTRRPPSRSRRGQPTPPPPSCPPAGR